jgi:hypothetical protein
MHTTWGSGVTLCQPLLSFCACDGDVARRDAIGACGWRATEPCPADAEPENDGERGYRQHEVASSKQLSDHEGDDEPHASPEFVDPPIHDGSVARSPVPTRGRVPMGHYGAVASATGRRLPAEDAVTSSVQPEAPLARPVRATPCTLLPPSSPGSLAVRCALRIPSSRDRRGAQSRKARAPSFPDHVAASETQP